MSERLANRYTVLALLGEGGMGQVFRVADAVADGQECALKVIKVEGQASEDQRLRFKAEFRAMTRLRHPNTIAVSDYGELEGGNLYIAMELVPGRELSDVIAGKPMAFDAAYPLIVQLLQALDFVHSRGYVHRDIKAQNVRVTPDGTLKLMDFGLMGQIGQPSARQVTGTPGYLAPEVAQGGVISAASDLYSVGCLAYEMLTGHLPFEGKLMDVIRAHVHTAPTPLRQRRADAPEALERIVMRLLEKEPGRRYRTAGLVVEDLAAIAGLDLARESLDQQLSFLETGEIIGRDAELAHLEAALAAARAGTARPIFVSAPAGTGKSRLVQELELKAKLAGFIVMHGGCHEDGMAPYEALVASLRPALPHGTDAERQRYLPTLARLFPDVAGADADGVETPDAASLAEAVRGWIADLSTRAPVLWLLDDLHWADGQTVEVFNHAIRGLGASAVLAIGTFRNDETPAGSAVWRTLEDGESEALRLSPLDPAAQAALVAAMLPDARMPAEFAAALDRATGGNPFFVTEVLRSLFEDGHLARRDGVWRFPTDPAVLRPLTSMEATIRRRLAHLSVGARELIGTAAVLGHAWDVCALSAVSGLGEDDLFVRLEELVEHHFLSHEGACDFRFPHDRVREVTYDGLDPATRRDLHRRAGEVLEARHADGADAHVHELARHFLQGEDGLRAYRYLMLAAEQADATGADATAIDRWRDAERVLAGLDLPDKAMHQLRVWLLIGWNGFVYMPEVSREMLGRAVAAYEADPATGDRLIALAGFHPQELYGLLGIVNGFCGRPAEARVAAEKARALMPHDGSPREGAILFVHAGGLMPTGRIDEMVVAAREAYALLALSMEEPVPQAVRGARVGSLGLQNAVTFQGVRPDPALRDQANEWARLINDENPFTTWFYFGLWAAWTGRHDEAQAYIDLTVQKSRKVGGPPYPWVLYLRPYLLWQRGEFALALEQVEKSLLAFPHLRQNALAFQHMLGLRGHSLLDVGRREEAAAVFADLEALGQERELGLTSMMGLLGRGRVAGAAGLPAAAREAYEALHALTREGPLRNPLYQARAARGLGNVAMALGDWEGAAGRFAEALAIAGRPEQDNLFLQGHLHRDRGKLHLRRGERDAATRELQRAGELFHQLRNPYWLHAIMRDLAGFHEQVVPKAEAKAEASPEARWQLMRNML